MACRSRFPPPIGQVLPPRATCPYFIFAHLRSAFPDLSAYVRIPRWLLAWLGMSKKSAITLFLVAAVVGGGGYWYAHREPMEGTVASLEAKLAKSPTNAELHERLAGMLLEAKQIDAAAEHFKLAIQYAPEKTSARCSLAGILVTKGDMLQAQKLLETNLKLSPRDSASNELTGDILMRTLGEKTPDVAYPLAAGYFDVALQGDPAREIAALGLSKIFLAQGKLSDAAGALQKAEEAHPKSAALHLQKARVLALAERYEQAADEYNRGTALDHENAKAYLEWGIMLIAAGRPTTAENVLRMAEGLDPKNAEIHMHLARALWNQQGSLEAAVKEFDKAIECDPNYAPVYLEIANTILSLHDNTQYGARIVASLRMAIQKDGHYTLAKLALAQYLLNQPNAKEGDLFEATDLLRECVQETHGQDLSVLVAYGDALANHKLYDLATEQVEKAIAWGSTHGLRPDAMELLYTRRQNYQLAQMPDLGGNGMDFLAIEGRRVHDPVDDPWPFPQQPTVESILTLPADLTRVPEPGSLLDPKNYTGEALRARGISQGITQGF